MTALTRRDLDKLRCQTPGCAHRNCRQLILLAGCHPRAGTEVEYSEGIITIRCLRCSRHVTQIAVKE